MLSINVQTGEVNNYLTYYSKSRNAWRTAHWNINVAERVFSFFFYSLFTSYHKASYLFSLLLNFVRNYSSPRNK